MKDVVAIAIIMVYNLVILGGTVYLISEKGWNPWWMAFAVLCLFTTKKKTETEKE